MGWWSGTGAKGKVVITDPAKYQTSQGYGNYLKSNVGKAATPYPWMDELTKMSETEKSGMGLLENYVSGESPLINATSRMIYGILSGDTGYLQGIEGPIQRELQNITLPTIQSAYGKGGTYFGTQRAQAEKEAAETASAGVLEQAMKLMPQALQLGTTIEPGQVEASQKFGALPRTLEEKNYQEWLRTQPEYSPWLETINAYVNQPTGGVEAYVDPGIAGASQGVAGGNCCFIFIKGDKFTDSVRRFRDKFFGLDSYVAKGYRKMAKWLVPAMDNKSIYKLVKTVMVNPMANFTEYREKGSHRDTYLVPICAFWVTVWWLYGRFSRQTNEGYPLSIDAKTNSRDTIVIGNATVDA